MQFSSWQRLVNLYERRMLRLMTAWRANRGPEWDEAIRRVTWDMVREVARVNASSWREAAMKSTKARQIYKALQNEIAETGIDYELSKIAARNARLIRSLPYDVAMEITQRAPKLMMAGMRPEQLAKELKALAPQLTKAKVKLISRTEIGRAESQVTRARAEHVGIRFFQWLSSEDQRVRPSHANMDKVLVAWDDLPNPEKLIGEPSSTSPYMPGAIWNCRCVAAPLADLSEVRWPCKLYSRGSIQRISRADFQKRYLSVAA